MKIDRDFLGRGWSFPPEFNKAQREVEMTTDVEDINNSLIILLSTRLGERVMRSDYGSDLEELLFKPLTLTLVTQIKGIVERAILYHEPRINILSIDIDSANDNDNDNDDHNGNDNDNVNSAVFDSIAIKPKQLELTTASNTIT